MKFLDQAKVFIKSGKGGAGCVAFRREKFIEFGGPYGGDGGRGGDVVAEAVLNLNTLIDYRYQQHVTAKNGVGGMGKNRHGPEGDSVVMRVPVGTQIFEEDGETLIADMVFPGQRVILARGGNGGFGNKHFTTSTNRAPRRANPGQAGEERIIWLRLKLIADVGLVGLPNAGKSTLLAGLTAAKPKIADYPFTTLHPNLGLVRQDNWECIIADIPGLIEGASLGHGLGDRFLGHVERCRILVHLIDASVADIGEAYRIIREELAAYKASAGPTLTDLEEEEISRDFATETLLEKKELVVLSKMDLLSEEEQALKKKNLQKAIDLYGRYGRSGEGQFFLDDCAKIEAGTRIEVGTPKSPILEKREIHMISAHTGEGVREFMWALFHHLQEIAPSLSPSEISWSP